MSLKESVIKSLEKDFAHAKRQAELAEKIYGKDTPRHRAALDYAYKCSLTLAHVE